MSSFRDFTRTRLTKEEKLRISELIKEFIFPLEAERLEQRLESTDGMIAYGNENLAWVNDELVDEFENHFIRFLMQKRTGLRVFGAEDFVKSNLAKAWAGFAFYLGCTHLRLHYKSIQRIQALLENKIKPDNSFERRFIAFFKGNGAAPETPRGKAWVAQGVTCGYMPKRCDKRSLIYCFDIPLKDDSSVDDDKDELPTEEYGEDVFSSQIDSEFEEEYIRVQMLDDKHKEHLWGF